MNPTTSQQPISGTGNSGSSSQAPPPPIPKRKSFSQQAPPPPIPKLSRGKSANQLPGHLPISPPLSPRGKSDTASTPPKTKFKRSLSSRSSRPPDLDKIGGGAGESSASTSIQRTTTSFTHVHRLTFDDGSGIISPRQCSPGTNGSGGQHIFLKVHFPWFLWKVLKFERNMTVADAVKYIETKRIHEASTSAYPCGLFIPAWYGNQSSGWLDDERTLGSYGLKNNDLIEFREKKRAIQVQSKSGRFEKVVVADTDTIFNCLSSIVRTIGADNIFEAARYPEKQTVVLLDKAVLLLHLPLPYHTQFVVLKNFEPASDSVHDLGTSFALYAKIPHFQGMMYKRGTDSYLSAKGRHAWKERWFVLEKDKIIEYRDPFDKKAISFIPIQRVREVNVCPPPRDASSIMKGISSSTGQDACFSLTTITTTYYLISPEKANQWRKTLEEWMRFKEFFGPERWLSQQFFDRMFEQNLTQPSVRKSTNVKQQLAKSPLRQYKQRRPSTSSYPEGVQNTLPLPQTATSKRSSRYLSSRQSRRLKALSTHVDAAMQLAIESALKDTELSSPVASSSSSSNPSSSSTPSSNQSPLSQISTNTSSSDDDDGSVDECEITLALADGTLAALIVDASWEVYDLVYAIGEDIGSQNASVISEVDNGPNRQVELLDHQKSLREHQLPQNAVYILKKTGIVDDFVGEDDIYDNHFLYVQLPTVEGYLELYNPAKQEWRRYWAQLKVDKLRLFAGKSSLASSGLINLELVEDNLTPSSNEQFGFGFDVARTNITFRAPNQHEQKVWIEYIRDWARFWRTQNFALRKRALRNQSFGTKLDEFIKDLDHAQPTASDESVPRRGLDSAEIKKTDSPFWQYLTEQQAEFQDGSTATDDLSSDSQSIDDDPPLPSTTTTTTTNIPRSTSFEKPKDPPRMATSTSYTDIRSQQTPNRFSKFRSQSFRNSLSPPHKTNIDPNQPLMASEPIPPPVIQPPPPNILHASSPATTKSTVHTTPRNSAQTAPRNSVQPASLSSMTSTIKKQAGQIEELQQRLELAEQRAFVAEESARIAQQECKRLESVQNELIQKIDLIQRHLNI